MFVVHDLHGRLVGYLDDDKLQDVNGKPFAHRASDEKHALSLSQQAARRMSGRTVLMDLGIGDVVQPATQFATDLPKPDFVADKVSRVRLINHDRGVFFAENAGDQIQLVLPNGGTASGAPVQVNPVFVNTPFTTKAYALSAAIPRHVLNNADFDLEKRTIRRLVNGLRMAREIRVASLLTTQANWPASNQVSPGANKWNAGTTPNPLGDMMSALKASFLPATTMIMPETTAQFFYVQPQASTGIRDYVQADGEMPDILYARGKQMSSGAPVYIWAPTAPATTNVALVRTSDDPDEIVTTQTIRWLGDAKDGGRVEGMLGRKFFDRNSDSWIFVVAHNDAEVFLSNQVGALIVGATQ